MQTTVVVNPRAGSGRAPDVWRRALADGVELGPATVVQVDSPDEARLQIEAALNRGVGRLIVVGGDGSIHLAANVILDAGRGDSVSLGIVPAGTGSDLARTLGLAADPRESLRRIVSGSGRAFDTLRLATDDGRARYIMNVASAGLSGLVDEAVNRMELRSELAYLRATLGALWRYEPVVCRIAVDGEPWFEGPIFLLAVANGSTFGRGMRIAPRAVVDDGLAEIVVIPAIGMLRVLTRLPQVYRGTHLNSHHVRYRRGRHVRLEPLGPLPPFDLDGETFPAAAAEWTVVPRALTILG